MDIRPLGLDDVDQLSTLSRRVFTNTYGVALPFESLSRFLDRAFDSQVLAIEVADPTVAVFGAWQAAELIGFSKVSEADCPECVSSSSAIELAKLYVAEDQQGRGVADSLLNASLTEAGRRGFSTLWLYVWERNLRALAYYKKWQFKVVGEVDLDFEEVVFHDLVMERKIDH